MLSEVYCANITLPDNVVQFPAQRVPCSSVLEVHPHLLMGIPTMIGGDTNMPHIIHILLVLTVVLLATPTAADHMYVDAQTLSGWCEPYKVGDPGPGSLCAGYINGVADILAHGVPLHAQWACIPHTVSLNDLRNLILMKLDPVVSELDQSFSGGHKNAHIWVAEVLAGAYPCFPANGE
jgi:hypothetical protein